MPSLRDYLYGYQPGEATSPEEFVVYHTSTTSQQNGGCCCLFTLPAGKNYVVFEIWSGGGSGAGVCCCQQGPGAGSGSYAIKGIEASPGDTFTICAASSSICTDPSWDNGCTGCSSWVCGNGGGGGPSWKLCVCGGNNIGYNRRCFYFINCYDCCSSCWCCHSRVTCSNSNATPDMIAMGTNGSAHPNQYCNDSSYMHASSAPFTAGGFRQKSSCRSWHAGCGNSTFPGGGGLTAAKYDNQCCGGEWGSGGMVYVLYY